MCCSRCGGERHGYAIMQEVAEHTDGQIKMGPALYTARSSGCSKRS